MIGLTWQEIAPEIRGANYFTATEIRLGPRCNYAYQLLYVFRGTGEAVINGESFRLEPGLLFLYGPGDRHEFRNTPATEMILGTVNFSWRREAPERLARGNRSVVGTFSPEQQFLVDPRYRLPDLPDLPFVLTIPPDLRPGLERRLRETGTDFRTSGDAARILRYKASLLEILYLLVTVSRNASGHQELPLLTRFREYIGKHYAEDICRADTARAVGVSPGYLTALLRRELQTSFTDFLTDTRMDAALELLQFSPYSVKEIAARSGFNDYSYFVARFRRRFGQSPGAFRRC